jgi:hypothetical protein
MEELVVRYGASLDFSVEIDDDTATTVTFFVGKEGETPRIAYPATFSDGVAYISLSTDDTKIPLGRYKYQITVAHSNGREYKYPTDEYCDEFGLPDFYVLEALDETEVVS